VKRGIIAEQRELLSKKRSDEVITQIRSSSTVTVHVDKLEALVIPADQALSKAAAPPSRAPAAAAKPDVPAK